MEAVKIFAEFERVEKRKYKIKKGFKRFLKSCPEALHCEVLLGESQVPAPGGLVQHPALVHVPRSGQENEPKLFTGAKTRAELLGGCSQDTSILALVAGDRRANQRQQRWGGTEDAAAPGAGAGQAGPPSSEQARGCSRAVSGLCCGVWLVD